MRILYLSQSLGSSPIVSAVANDRGDRNDRATSNCVGFTSTTYNNNNDKNNPALPNGRPVKPVSRRLLVRGIYYQQIKMSYTGKLMHFQTYSISGDLCFFYVIFCNLHVQKYTIARGMYYFQNGIRGRSRECTSFTHDPSSKYSFIFTNFA